GPGCSPGPWICDLYDDSAVYEYEGKLYRVPYTAGEGGVSITADPAEVMRSYVPIGQGGDVTEAGQAMPGGGTDVQQSEAGKSATLKRGLVTKDAGDEHYILGIVLEPDVVDAQNDTYSADEVQQAEQRFMVEFRNVGLMHKGYINDKVKIVESYIAPVDFT